jgi:hypothetical protein
MRLPWFRVYSKCKPAELLVDKCDGWVIIAFSNYRILKLAMWHPVRILRGGLERVRPITSALLPIPAAIGRLLGRHIGRPLRRGFEKALSIVAPVLDIAAAARYRLGRRLERLLRQSLRACLKTRLKRRVRARGLQIPTGIHLSCRPGAPTGLVFKQALRK